MSTIVERLKKSRRRGDDGMPVYECYGCYDRERAEAAADIERLTAENERLRARVTDAEIAIGVWDDTRSSEYWLRYPHRINQQETVRPDKSCQCGLTAEGRCPVCCTVPQ